MSHWLVWLCLAWLGGSSAKYYSVENVLLPSQAWSFVDKFCMSTEGGYMKMRVFANLSDPRLSDAAIALYSDSEDQWGTYYPNRQKTSCEEKVAPAANLHSLTKMDGEDFLLRTVAVRDRWWYVILTNCNPIVKTSEIPGPFSSLEPAIINKFEITWTNTESTYEQFGKNEMGVYEISIAFTVTMALILFSLVYAKQIAKLHGRQYHVIKMMALAVLMTFWGAVCRLLHYSTFAEDGVGLPQSLDFSFFFECLGDIVMASILLDLGSGWAISTNFLPGRRQKWLLLVLYFAANTFLFVTEKQTNDPATTVYIYGTISGLLIVITRVILLLWFVKCLVTTLQFETMASRRHFYMIFGVFSILWFVSLPVSVGIGLALKSWWRAKVVYAVDFAFKLAGYLFMTFIFFPADCNKFIGVLDPNESVEFGANTMQVFPELQLTAI